MMGEISCVCRCNAGPWKSEVSTFNVWFICELILSPICWRASSLQTQGVFSLQKPQSNVSIEPPVSNRLLLLDDMMSKILLNELPWAKTGVSRGGGREGMGEKLVWPVDSGDDAAEDGDDA